MSEGRKMPTPGDLFGAPKRPNPEMAVRESSDGTNPDDTVASAAVLDHTRDNVPAEKLQRLGALDENGELTEIGRQMEQFASESPEHARMLAEAERFPETVRTQVAAIVALQKTPADLVVYGSKKRPCKERWRNLIDSEHNDSDWLKQLEVLASIQNMPREELLGYDIRPGVPGKVKRELRRLKNQQGLTECDLTLPSDEERKQIVKCIIAGSADKLWRQMNIRDLVSSYKWRSEVFAVDTRRLVDTDKGRLYRNSEGEERKRSQRSLIKMGQLVVADPEDICFRQNGKEAKIPVLKGITNVKLSDLREVAPQLFADEDRGFVVGSDDKPVKLVESVLDNGLLQLGEQRIAAEPSEEMANFVVEYIAKNNRTRLMGRTNTYLARLTRKSGQPFREFSDEDLETRIAEHLAAVGLTDENGELRRISEIAEGVASFTAAESCGQETVDDINRLYPDYVTSGDEKLEVEYQRNEKYTGPYFSYRTVNVDNILDIDPKAFEIPSGQQIMCQREKREFIGDETWTSLVIVPPEEVREKASQIRAEQQKQEEAAKRERAFYADVENAIAWMESFGNELPAELQKQRLALTIDLRYVAYEDENSAKKLNELIAKVTSWCAACGKYQ
jgi:helicase associated domain (HA2)